MRTKREEKTGFWTKQQIRAAFCGQRHMALGRPGGVLATNRSKPKTLKRLTTDMMRSAAYYIDDLAVTSGYTHRSCDCGTELKSICSATMVITGMFAMFVLPTAEPSPARRLSGSPSRYRKFGIGSVELQSNGKITFFLINASTECRHYRGVSETKR